MFRTEPLVELSRTAVARDPADGSPAELPLFVARPAGSAGEKRPGILLIQEIFGIDSHIQDVARRLAGAGYVVVAPDMLYRVGPWTTFGYDQVAQAIAPFRSLTEDLIVGDMQAALGFLGAQPDVDPARLGVMGFCFGGRASLLAAIRLNEQVKAAVIYYGGGIVTDAPNAPYRRVGAVRCPVIGFFGALDGHIPPEHVARLEQALTEAGVENEIYCYPHAGHGFFCEARPSYHPQSAQDAWHRTLTFLARTLGPVPGVADQADA